MIVTMMGLRQKTEKDYFKALRPRTTNQKVVDEVDLYLKFQNIRFNPNFMRALIPPCLLLHQWNASSVVVDRFLSQHE